MTLRELQATAGHIVTANISTKACEPGARVTAICAALFIASVVFAPVVTAQTFTLLHQFTGSGDGAEPVGGLLLNGSTLYGTTYFGGSFNYGTVYQLDLSGKEAVVHNFLGGEGLWPESGLTRDPAGNLYGTAFNGGAYEGGGCAHGCGVVFKRDTSGNQTVLYAFTGGTDGGNPDATLIQDAAGNFYGTTEGGGQLSCFFGSGCGTVFKLSPSNQETVLYRFTDRLDGDGEFPAGVVADAAGNLYGTTYDGGAYGYGDVFKITPSGTFSIFYSFTGGTDSGDPKSPLIIDQAGNLYGTTEGIFETSDYGVVYKLNPSGNITVLYSFTGGSVGSYPYSLVLDQAGNLYGTALAGGTGTGCYYGSCGIVFQLDTSNNFTLLHSFTGADGQLPNNLTIDKEGNLYGTTLGGGIGRRSTCGDYQGCGVVFEITP
jgi:uncharacterized repeat protein (TIGR03803 family)